MSTSDKLYGRYAKRMFAGTCFTALFGAIYELFSHEVYAYPMLYAFAWPLLGTGIYLFLFGTKWEADQTALNLLNMGIFTLTMGSLFLGALKIYGTTNRLTVLYWILGALLLGGSALRGLYTGMSRKAPAKAR